MKTKQKFLAIMILSSIAFAKVNAQTQAPQTHTPSSLNSPATTEIKDTATTDSPKSSQMGSNSGMSSSDTTTYHKKSMKSMHNKSYKDSTNNMSTQKSMPNKSL